MNRLTRATANLQTSQVLYTYRRLSHSARLSLDPSFKAPPAPPRLPQEEQDLYEKLQRSSTGAFSTPRRVPTINQSPGNRPAGEQPALPVVESDDAQFTSIAQEQKAQNVNAKVQADGAGEELHPNLRRGAAPEFEGERNPKTGEVGGPKNDPLRWGSEVDWSYNGRVTDF